MPNSDYVDGQHDMLDNAMYHRIMDGIFDFDESIMDSFNASVAASPAVGQNSMFGQGMSDPLISPFCIQEVC